MANRSCLLNVVPVFALSFVVSGQLAIKGQVTFEFVDPSGRPKVNHITLEVEGEKGNVTVESRTLGGSVVVTDMPFGSHTVILNRGKCDELRLVGIRFSYSIQQKYKVVFNPCSRLSPTGGNACALELRIRDGQLLPARGAKVTAPSLGSFAADEHGRAFSLLRPGRTLLAIEYRGKAKSLEVECRNSELIQEESITN